MSYKPPSMRANADDGWTTVQPKLTRGAFDSAPEAKKSSYVPPSKRGPNKPVEAATIDEAFPELSPPTVEKPAAKKSAWDSKRSAVDIVAAVKKPEPVPIDTPIVRTVEDVINMREGVPASTKIIWEFTKLTYESSDPKWVAARAQINQYVRQYGDEIHSPYRIRVVDISGQDDGEPDLPAFSPAFYQKMRELKERQQKRAALAQKMRNKPLFDSASESDTCVEAEEDEFADYESKSDDDSNEIEANDDEY